MGREAKMLYGKEKFSVSRPIGFITSFTVSSLFLTELFKKIKCGHFLRPSDDHDDER